MTPQTDWLSWLAVMLFLAGVLVAAIRIRAWWLKQ